MIGLVPLSTAPCNGPRQRLGRGVGAHVGFHVGFGGLVGGRVNGRVSLGHCLPSPVAGAAGNVLSRLSERPAAHLSVNGVHNVLRGSAQPMMRIWWPMMALAILDGASTVGFIMTRATRDGGASSDGLPFGTIRYNSLPEWL